MHVCALNPAAKAPIRYIRMQDKTGNMGIARAFKSRTCKYVEAQIRFTSKAIPKESTLHSVALYGGLASTAHKTYPANAFKLPAFALNKVSSE